MPRIDELRWSCEVKEYAVPCVPHSSVECSDLLGTGTFSQVFRVKLSSLSAEHSDTLSSDVLSPDEENRPESRFYVIKKLRPSFPLADATIFRASAAADLAVEARILSSLPRHTNIITLHAISENFFSDPDSGFLVLDGLSETLSDRIKWWRSEMKGGLAVLSLLQSKAQTRFEKAREVSRATSIGLPVASAMSFLHKRRIVYRDIKPANVGFDHQGNVRIFDFGLARVYNPKRGLMTPCSGTIRYMCPVAMTGGNYDLSADVYSFAILLWEVCNRTQQQPFASIKSVEAAKRSIAGMRYRPPLRQIYNANLKKIMRYGWDQDPQMRPSFPSIVSTLERMKPKES